MELYDIEQILLGKLIISPELLDKYGDLIHKDLFTFPVNISTYVALCKLKENNKDIDIVSLSKIVKGENISYNLAHMLDVGYSPVKITNCIATLTENYHKNTLAALVNDINNKLSEGEDIEPLVDYVNTQVSKLSIKTPEQLPSITKQITGFLQDTETRMNTDGLLGIASGFKDIDSFTGGWQSTDLIIVGGASSMGKTSFALALAYNAAKHSNTSTVIFSYEMSAIQLIRRLTSMESEINNSYITNGTISNDDMKQIHHAVGTIQNTPLHIDEANITSLGYLVTRIKDYVKDKQVKLVLVDYLQLVSYKTKSTTREQEVSQVARSLKNLAKELDITIIALSQLNRGVGMRNNSKPTLSDLRESGEIEQAADVVMLIYRPEYYGIEFDDDGNTTKGNANIIFAKGRNIGVGEVRLRFKSHITKFIDYA